jgi:HD-GYP domain-containing protein (c-di-GMP phosphodiesterase class II)
MSSSLSYDNRPLYNSRVIDAYIKMIVNKYPHVNLRELFDYAEMEPYEVEDHGHWFTQRQIDQFYKKVVELTGNEHIAREAGRYAVSPDAIGIMRQYVLGLVGPANAYKLIGKTASNFTRSSIFESRSIGSNHAEIVVSFLEGVNEKPFQCENRIGFLEAVVMAFNNKLPHIDHPECIFNGGRVCRYVIGWDSSLSEFLKKIRSVSAISLVLVCLIFLYFLPSLFLPFIFPLAISSFSILLFWGERAEKNELKKYMSNLRSSIDQHLEQTNTIYNNALLINEIGQSISKQIHVDDVLNDIVRIAQNRLSYDRGMILLANPEKTHLKFVAGYGYSSELLPFIKNTAFNLTRQNSKGTLVESFHKQKPYLINDIEQIKDIISKKSLDFVLQAGSRSFICCPIVSEGESLGVFVVDNVESKAPLVQSDISLLMGIACSLGISIRKVELLEARQRQFTSILHVLAASIDARDPLTSGHSEKVTEYVMGICTELGLTKEYREMMRVAALLHDYGKIGVPDSILKKPGKLTTDEYEQIKTHAAKTRNILCQVEFDGIFKQVPEIAGSHHEKIDGSGYPLGLKGEDIPLGARILAVADFFEAVTAKRHYRESMTIDEAFHLLRIECKNDHFEKNIVEALIRFLQPDMKSGAIDNPKQAFDSVN